MFHKILIANRGEIACRIIATAKKCGIQTVAVYSDADAQARHVALADEAIHIGPAPASESYLIGKKIIDAALQTGAQAIHPGYGFLSENAAFAEQCTAQGLVFIGPPASAIIAMGSKSRAKQLMEKAGVPLVPGYHGDDQNPATLKQAAIDCGFPAMIKASAGGGGKGMRIVESLDVFDEALASAKREAQSSFGDDKVLIEKYLQEPRHIEIQVFADRMGNAVHLFERDCSVQRRHQKVIEEAPAPGLSEDIRASMGEAAIAAAKAIQYVGAGTVEFIMDKSGEYFFMEMNTRLQVEHPVTEMITRKDLVEWQLRIAAGESLPANQNQLHIHGHAFEARIYAEDPNNNFLPATGKLGHLQFPAESPHTRIDTGVREGDNVSIHYDPMIAKLIVWDENREAALRRMHNALRSVQIVGLANNVDFLDQIICHPSFSSGQFDTGFIDKHSDVLLQANNHQQHLLLTLASLFILEHRKHTLSRASSEDIHSPWHCADSWRLNLPAEETLQFKVHNEDRFIQVTHRAQGYRIQPTEDHASSATATLTAKNMLEAFVDGQKVTASVIQQGAELHVFTHSASGQFQLIEETHGGLEDGDSTGNLVSPMPGTIIDVLVQDGDSVATGQTLLLLEAMKMEHAIKAPADGVIKSVKFAKGDMVEEGVALIEMEA